MTVPAALALVVWGGTQVTAARIVLAVVLELVVVVWAVIAALHVGR